MWSKLFNRRVGEEEEPLPERELSKTRWFSPYRRSWRRCSWKIFHARNPHRSRGGYPRLHMCPTFGLLEKLLDRPGVYEMALVKEGTSRRCKVYIGHTESILRRFRQYKECGGPFGSHLAPFLAGALENGCQVHMRCHYTDTVEEARQHQEHIQAQFDYAWCLHPSGRPPRVVELSRKLVTGCCRTSVQTRPTSKPIAEALPLPTPMPNKTMADEASESAQCEGFGPQKSYGSNVSVEWTAAELLQMLEEWDPQSLLDLLGVPPDRDTAAAEAAAPALGPKSLERPSAAFSMTAHCY